MMPLIAPLGWPLCGIYLFSRLSLERAIIWSVVGSFLFLPSSFAIDLPGLPAIDKVSMPGLVLLVMVLVHAPKRFRLLPGHRLAALLFVILMAGSLATALTNPDPVLIGPRVLPGMTPYDALSQSTRTFLTVIPFLVGWQYLATPSAHLEILKVLFAAGLVYSVLMLFEVRMSPQLHTWVYGYFPHSFAQQVRGDGFRPVVFLRHGLWVAFFAMTVTVAAAALRQHVKATGQKVASLWSADAYLTAMLYFGVVLVLCKSLGSLLYGLFAVPLVLVTEPRTQIRIAALMAAVAIAYPLLRGAELVPVDRILEAARSVSEARYQSLNTRITNEERLLEHARARPVFGWGSWSRNRVFDAETGQDISITDGYWVIVIGTSGWVGYIATFGLLGLPVILIWRRGGRAGVPPLEPATAALCLLLGINMIELLPNSTLPPWTWLIAGSLLGRTAQADGAGPVPRRESDVMRTRTVL